MKPSRSVSAHSKLKWSAVILGLLCSLSLHAASLNCEGVTLSLIDLSARANIEILEGRASDADIEAALQMPGNLALVQKSNQNGSSNTIEDLRIALKKSSRWWHAGTGSVWNRTPSKGYRRRESPVGSSRS